MKCLGIITNRYGCKKTPAVILLLSMLLAALSVAAQSYDSDGRGVTQAQILADFEAARDAGRNVDAAKFALQ